jgi:hypothetical protein
MIAPFAGVVGIEFVGVRYKFAALLAFGERRPNLRHDGVAVLLDRVRVLKPLAPHRRRFEREGGSVTNWQPLDEDAPPREPEGAYRPPGEPASPAHQKFTLEPWRDIAFVVFSEWLIKQFLPLQGLAAIFGKPGSFKSFVALHIALCIASGRPWGIEDMGVNDSNVADVLPDAIRAAADFFEGRA